MALNETEIEIATEIEIEIEIETETKTETEQVGGGSLEATLLAGAGTDGAAARTETAGTAAAGNHRRGSDGATATTAGAAVAATGINIALSFAAIKWTSRENPHTGWEKAEGINKT